jgi:hypothetical protein
VSVVPFDTRVNFITSKERAALDRLAQSLGEALAANIVLPTMELPPQQAPVEGFAVNVQQLVNGTNGSDTTPSVYTVAGGAALWPLSVMCRLTTSAVVADRTVALEYRDANGTRFLVAGTQAIVQAGNVQSFCWHPQVGDVTWPVEDAALAPLPQQHLLPGWQLAVKIGSGQTGDVLDQVVISARFDPLAERD